MIEEVVFDWNVLTVTTTIWIGLVCLAVAADVVPDVYREEKARIDLAESAAWEHELRETQKPVVFDPEDTHQLGVYKIQKPPGTPPEAREARIGEERSARHHYVPEEDFPGPGDPAHQGQSRRSVTVVRR